MEKVIKNSYSMFFYFIFLSALLFPSFQITASECCNCGCESVCKDYDRPINYEQLGDYEEMYKTFEEQMDIEEADSDPQARTFFLKRWCKKLKRWFKKRIVSLLKKMINLKKCQNPDYCAYTVAKFKRKIDKVYDTGSIEEILAEFDKNVAEGHRTDFIDSFKDRIRYYHRHKRASPRNVDSNPYNFCVQCKAKHDSQDKKHNPLEEYPVRAVFGGLEIACGSLIFILPFPGCKYLGVTLMGHGLNNIYEGYLQQLEEQKNEKKDRNAFAGTSTMDSSPVMQHSLEPIRAAP